MRSKKNWLRSKEPWRSLSLTNSHFRRNHRFWSSARTLIHSNVWNDPFFMVRWQYCRALSPRDRDLGGCCPQLCWQGTITVYVAVKGSLDIRGMLRRLKDNDEKDKLH